MGKISIIRRKLKDKNWIKNRINKLLKESHELQTFYTFECSTFFRGDLLASRNLKHYYKRLRKITNQIKFLESIKV